MSLQVSSFELSVDLATIPANREWNFSPNSPQPNLLLPLNRNVLVKKIEAEFDMTTTAPNDNIIIESWSLRFRPTYLDGVFILGFQGTIINPVAGVFTVIPGSPVLTIDNYNTSLSFDDNFLLGGITIWNNCQIKFSNTTTVLPADFNIYVNIYWEELC
jgi:hypothetical protein